MVLLSCFLYLAYEKPYGTLAWGTVTVVFPLIGLRVAKKRAPEITQIKQTDGPMNMIFSIAESGAENVHIYFRSPQETSLEDTSSTSVYVSLYSPWQENPGKLAPNHLRFANHGQTLYDGMVEIMHALSYELPDRNFTIHCGWPLSSWVGRMAIGVMIFSIMRLTKILPGFNFVIEYFGKSVIPATKK
jgi:hypothetical protein